MNPETLFTVCTAIVLPGWVLLVLAPYWKWTRRLVLSFILPLILAAIYVALVLSHFEESGGGFSSLQAVATLFHDPYLLLAGWIHYLAFDLFVGTWETYDAQRESIPHSVVIVCLIATFLLGPSGLLLYFIVRWIMRRGIIVGGTFANP